MAQTPTRQWDPAEHLKSDEDAAAYLDVALEDGDEALILAVLGDIARAPRVRASSRRSAPDHGAG